MNFAVVPLRRVARIINGGTPVGEPNYWDGDVPWATPVDLGQAHGALLTATGRSLTAAGVAAGSALVPAGSVLVSTRAPIGYVARTDRPMAFNQGCRGLVPGPNVDSRFLALALMAAQEMMQARGSGSTFMELSSEGLASLPIPLPGLADQRSIADFLDCQLHQWKELVRRGLTQKILVEESLHSRVEDARLALATQHKSARLRHIAEKITVGIVVRPADLYAAEGCPFLRGQNLSSRGITRKDLRYISPVDNAKNGKSILRSGDVLVSRVGLTGQAAEVPTWAVGGNCVGMLLVRPGQRLHSRYLHLMLNARGSQQQLQAMSGGSVQEVLNTAALAELVLPVPPIREQEAVAETLSDAVRVAEKTITVLERQEHLIKERQQGLVSAAVTGELDLTTARGVA